MGWGRGNKCQSPKERTQKEALTLKQIFTVKESPWLTNRSPLSPPSLVWRKESTGKWWSERQLALHMLRGPGWPGWEINRCRPSWVKALRPVCTCLWCDVWPPPTSNPVNDDDCQKVQRVRQWRVIYSSTPSLRTGFLQERSMGLGGICGERKVS